MLPLLIYLVPMQLVVQLGSFLYMGLPFAVRPRHLVVLFRVPGFTGTFLDVSPYELAHHLGGRYVVFRTELLEEGFLSRVDQDRQTCSAGF